MKNRLFEIWFSLCVGAANTEFQGVLERFGTPYDVFNAEEAELESLSVSPRLKQALLQKSLQESMRIEQYCKQNGIGILFWQDEEYPAALRSLRDPPVLLYYRGKLPHINHRLCISVVGTRSMSEYGKRMAYKIGYELASAGAIVVSGMALGNDSVATAGAISAGGTPLAVLGCGVDVVYPRQHATLYDEILRTGAILSEYPPGTSPIGSHFPVRNRIISGLSQGTLVVEGDIGSGALITAKSAILQGRDIYALPGNVGETNSAGTNRLISEGAGIVFGAKDILENYAFIYRDVLNMKRFADAQKLSDPDDAQLARLGVCTRTIKVRDDGNRPASVPQPEAKTPVAKPTPRKSATPPPQKKAESSPAKAPERNDAKPILDSLTNTQRRVFEAIPIDGMVTVEHLTGEGFSMSEIMASVTILEIKGLIITLPGGLMSRK